MTAKVDVVATIVVVTALTDAVITATTTTNSNAPLLKISVTSKAKTTNVLIAHQVRKKQALLFAIKGNVDQNFIKKDFVS